MFSFCGQEWSRNAENPSKPLFSVGVAVEHRNHVCLFTMVVSLVHWFGNCIICTWKCIQEETFQAKQMPLIRYLYMTKKLPWKHTHLVWIKGVGFRTGDIIQLDKLVKYWQEAERQQCLCWREHTSAFLIEHSQDFHTHNGWLQEPKRFSPVQCPAWFIIPSVVKGRFAFPGSSYLVREQGGYLQAASPSRKYFYYGSHGCMQAYTIENLMTEKEPMEHNAVQFLLFKSECFCTCVCVFILKCLFSW